ncbi:MAG: MFS transporter, partial [Flavobacterium sp.]
PSGLFVLFFTEMWERFSFYGMRVLLINFLTMAAIGTNPGWEWSSENAGALFGTYAGLLYLTPIVGGIIADRFTGYRWAVVIGAVIMTLGHAAMALETEFSLYFGLVLLVIGTGFFKPNITSIISEMYKDLPEKKDGAYTIFYMGVNAGAFFGMMLCGYLAEKVGWSWGFGLAGIFMLLGSLQFWLAKPLFGTIGDVPKKDTDVEATMSPDGMVEDRNLKNVIKPIEKRNPFTTVDKILIVITSIIGLLYLINDPVSKIGKIHLLPQEFLLSKDILAGPLVITIIGLILFLFLVISRIVRYERIVRDRMIAVIIFAFFTVFFWLSFEQGATSLVLFARDYT